MHLRSSRDESPMSPGGLVGDNAGRWGLGGRLNRYRLAWRTNGIIISVLLLACSCVGLLGLLAIHFPGYSFVIVICPRLRQRLGQDGKEASKERGPYQDDSHIVIPNPRPLCSSLQRRGGNGAMKCSVATIALHPSSSGDDGGNRMALRPLK